MNQVQANVRRDISIAAEGPGHTHETNARVPFSMTSLSASASALT